MDFKECLTKEEKRNMARTAQSKEEQTKPTFHHLKPLSAYSSLICDPKTSFQPPWNSLGCFTNFKIVNNCAQKRKLERSSCDDGYETPSKKVPLDVDDVLCLSPISTNANTAVKGSDGVISWRNKPGHESEFTDPQKKMQEEMKENRNVKDELENKGHFPVCYSKQQPTVQQQESITDSGLYSSGSVLVLDSWNFNVGGFEEVQCISPIGPPIFESTLCCGDSRELSFKELPGASADSIDSHHNIQGDDAGDTSWETTLPLKVKVKSAVVVPKPQTTCYKADPTVPDQNHANLDTGEKESESAASKHRRAAVVKEELTWEQQKNQYINLVTKHIDGNTESQDVMTELLGLMTQVADQTPVGDASWQHPSNLTRRNYQRHFDFSAPKISLQEWHTKNGTAHKRFATIPKIFKRSPLP